MYGSDAMGDTELFCDSVYGDLTATQGSGSAWRMILCWECGKVHFCRRSRILTYEKSDDELTKTSTYFSIWMMRSWIYTSVTVDNALSMVSGIKVVYYQEGEKSGADHPGDGRCWRQFRKGYEDESGV